MSETSVAIVTGAGRGLGLTIARLLKDNGCLVVIFDNNQTLIDNLRDEFLAIKVDVTCEDEVLAGVNQVEQKHEKINILINNAGVIYSQPLVNLLNKQCRVHDYENYKSIIDVNLNSVFLVGSIVAEKMISKRVKGVIINISSICANGNAGQSAYSAAKAGVNALTKTWAKELGPFGIRVVAISPGFINTPSTQNALSSDMINDIERAVPLRKLGEDYHIAALVLATISNTYISGAVLDVHGGLSI